MCGSHSPRGCVCVGARVRGKVGGEGGKQEREERREDEGREQE
jgi:hypothetical protein